MHVVEMHLKVYELDENNCLTIRPSNDFPEDNIMLIAEGKENEEYFGKIVLDLPKEMMKMVGESLIKVSNSLEG